MNIDELSGKELGIEVAKKVMEWRCGREWREGDSVVWFDSGLDHLRILRPIGKGVLGFLWAPWRSMDDCWEVVEKVTDPQIRGCRALPPNTLFGFWWDNAHLWASSRGQACQEILRAALKAKGAG